MQHALRFPLAAKLTMQNVSLYFIFEFYLNLIDISSNVRTYNSMIKADWKH